MPTKTVEFPQTQTDLKKLILLVIEGNEIILTEGNIPVARLIPITSSPTAIPRIPGLHPGAIKMADNFDDPLPDEFWLGTDQ